MRSSLFFVLFSALVASVQSQSVQVTLDIQGKDFTGTIPITTGPRPVFDGTLCDAGSNSATPTTALVDASDKFEFNVQSQYDEAMKDFIITAIDVDEADSSHRWNIYINDALVTNGGCHVAVASGDKVKFALEPIGDITVEAEAQT